eukprot:3331286-Pyramimonas_sp.AAC.1
MAEQEKPVKEAQELLQQQREKIRAVQVEIAAYQVELRSMVQEVAPSQDPPIAPTLELSPEVLAAAPAW